MASGGDIEIMHRDRVAQSGALAEHRGDVPAVGLAAEAVDYEALERPPRQHDDAVIALLAVERDMLIAEPLEALERKAVVGALRLLEAEDVGTNRLDEFGDQVDAQPHRIDVPGREFERNGHQISGISDQDVKSNNRSNPNCQLLSPVSRMRCSTKWCTADPGSQRTPRPQRSRVCSASLRAALRPGNCQFAP